MKFDDHGVKLGVAYIGTPKQLKDFLWYSCTLPQKMEWTAICQSKGDVIDYLSNCCKNSGLFSEIIAIESIYNKSKVYQILLMLRMLSAYVFHRSKGEKKRLLKELTGVGDADLWVVSCDHGIIPGLIIANSKDEDVVILEDGMSDYLYKELSFKKVENKSLKKYVGYLFAKMGYFDPIGYFGMEENKNCVKYSEFPQKMVYRNYKTIKKLNDSQEVNGARYKALLKRTFGEADKYGEYDYILFTTDWSYFTTNLVYKEKIENYLSEVLADKNVIIKKHPRDEWDYHFDCRKLGEINKNLPAEIFLSSLSKNVNIIMLFPSTLIELCLNNGNPIEVVHLNKVMSSKFDNMDLYESNYSKCMNVLDCNRIIVKEL